MAKNKTLLEWQEQELIFRWAKANQVKIPGLRWLNASLGGVRLFPGLRAKMKRQGMPKGFPDIQLPIKAGGYNSLYIELKRMKGGVVSPEQRLWLEHLNTEGSLAVVARGHKEAIKIILDYIN